MRVCDDDDVAAADDDDDDADADDAHDDDERALMSLPAAAMNIHGRWLQLQHPAAINAMQTHRTTTTPPLSTIHPTTANLCQMQSPVLLLSLLLCFATGDL